MERLRPVVGSTKTINSQSRYMIWNISLFTLSLVVFSTCSVLIPSLQGTPDTCLPAPWASSVCRSSLFHQSSFLPSPGVRWPEGDTACCSGPCWQSCHTKPSTMKAENPNPLLKQSKRLTPIGNNFRIKGAYKTRRGFQKQYFLLYPGLSQFRLNMCLYTVLSLYQYQEHLPKKGDQKDRLFPICSLRTWLGEF